MSTVAISSTTGSLGDEVGLALARTLTLQFADREIIAVAAKRFHEDLLPLIHVTEERPKLLERLRHSERPYVAAVEASVLEMAARDNVVLCGRGAAFVLRGIPHVLRVRMDAPEPVRAQRVHQRDGLTYDAALDFVRRTDHERAARIRFLYAIDWNDPLGYHIVLNTDQITVETAVQTLRALLETHRFVGTAESRQQLTDQSIVAQAKVALLAEPATRTLGLAVSSSRGYVLIGGMVDREDQRETAYNIVRAIPDVAGVLNEIVVRPKVHVAPTI